MAKANGIAQFAQGRTEVFKVDPRLLIIDEADDYRSPSEALTAHIDQLAQSIAEVGVKKPIEVKLEDGKIIVKEGRCRTRAAMRAIEHYKADLKAVPVISVDRYANEADLILNQFIGNSGKPFTALEQAKIFKKLLDMGWNQSDIAKKVGYSNGRISQILDLMTLPNVLQVYIVEGKASSTMVMNMFKKHNGNADAVVAELEYALAVAASEGRTRAMPKDTEGSDSEGGEKQSKEKKERKAAQSALEKHLKAMIEKAYVDGRIDESENMVTLSMSDDDWAELMQMIDY